MPLFNYKGVMHTGSFQSYCWQYAKKIDNSSTNDFFNPLGTVMNSNESGPCLFFELTRHENSQIVYPSEEDVFATAAKVVQANDGDNVLLVKGGKQHREQIEDIVKRDSLETMVEQDKELLWKLRFVKCSDFESLCICYH